MTDMSHPSCKIDQNVNSIQHIVSIQHTNKICRVGSGRHYLLANIAQTYLNQCVGIERVVSYEGSGLKA